MRSTPGGGGHVAGPTDGPYVPTDPHAYARDVEETLR